MKKTINLVMASSLMGVATMQAQTVIAELGFEEGDTKFVTSGALTPGGTFGDWVNKKDDDQWDEQSTDAHTGSFAFAADNSGETANTYDRGFKLGNLSIKENTPYRVSFWVKADQEDAGINAWLSKGIEYYERSLCTSKGTAYGLRSMGQMTGDWVHMSFVSYYHGADVINDYIAQNQSWMGGSVYPEELGGDGVETYAQHFGNKLPEEFFVILHAYSPSSYVIDDIKVEEGVTFNEATFSLDVIRLDFGYPTNIASLAAANDGTLSLDPSCVKVTVNGEEAEVTYVEGKSDGYLYVFLSSELGGDEDVKISFTPSDDCPIVYNTDQRPSADAEGDMKVLGFEGETVYSVDEIDVLPMAWTAPVLTGCDPENDSFELDAATFKGVTLSFNKELDLQYTKATLLQNGIGTDVSKRMSLSEDKKSVFIELSGLKDGEYTLSVNGVANAYGIPCDENQTVNFSLGIDKDQTVSESVYSTNETFANTANGTFPVGWVADDNGTIHEYGLTEGGEVWNYNWGGNIGGGGCRSMTGYSGDLNGAAIYWRCMNNENTLGKLTFGAQVADFLQDDGSVSSDMDERIGLYLEPRKYSITIRMCAWKNLNGNTDAVNPENAPTYNFTLEDLDGEVYARFTDIKAMPNVNGAQNVAVNNVTRSTADFTVSKAGYYVLNFNTSLPNAELLLGGVDLITMPSKAAYYKQLLAEAVERAQETYDLANFDDYDCETRSVFFNAVNRAKTETFHTPSEVNALIATIDDYKVKVATRVTDTDDYNIYRLTLPESLDAMDAKYKKMSLVSEVIEAVEKYQNIDATTLSDEELSTVAALFRSKSSALANIPNCVDLLLKGINTGLTTLTTLGAEAVDISDVVDDDRDVAYDINAKATIALYQKIAAGEDLDQYMTKLYDTTNPAEEWDENDPNYDENGFPLIAKGVDFTGLIMNPNFYTYEVNTAKPLEDNTMPGWMCEQLEGGSVHVFDRGATAENPVIEQNINSYGSGSEYIFKQTIEFLPAGVYTVSMGTRTAKKNNPDDDGNYGVFNAQNDETGLWDKYVFAQVDDEEPITVPFAAGGGWGQTFATLIPNVVVKEGQKLTIGAVEHYTSGKASGHDWTPGEGYNATGAWDTNTYVRGANLYFSAPLEGYDYAKAASDLETDVEEIISAPSKATVKAIYNANGVKISHLEKGINIVVFSNGNVVKLNK